MGEFSEMAKKRNPSSFVARIRLERGTNGDPIWRGYVRHIQGGQEAYFQDFLELNEFLERVSGVSGPGAPGLTLSGRKSPTV